MLSLSLKFTFEATIRGQFGEIARSRLEPENYKMIACLTRAVHIYLLLEKIDNWIVYYRR